MGLIRSLKASLAKSYINYKDHAKLAQAEELCYKGVDGGDALAIFTRLNISNETAKNYLNFTAHRNAITGQRLNDNRSVGASINDFAFYLESQDETLPKSKIPEHYSFNIGNTLHH
jgi:hypothetical protein